MVLRRMLLGQRLHGRVLLGRGVDELVFNIGDIDDPLDVVTFVLAVALDGIEHDRADHVTDVRRLIDGRPAQVDADFAGAHRNEDFFVFGESIVNT